MGLCEPAPSGIVCTHHTMPKVFISYRRADTAPNYLVKRIGAMCAECGFEEVFVDRDVSPSPTQLVEEVEATWETWSARNS